MVSSKGTFVNRLFISKEHIWSEEDGLLRRFSTKLNESFTQKLENFLETGLKKIKSTLVPKRDLPEFALYGSYEC